MIYSIFIKRLKIALSLIIALTLIAYFNSLIIGNLNVLQKIADLQYIDTIGDNGSYLLEPIIWLGILLTTLLGWHRFARRIMYSFAILHVILLIFGTIAIFLSITLYKTGTDAMALITDGLAVWWANIMLFTLLYWITDWWGPAYRHTEQAGTRDILFPAETSQQIEYKNWKPKFFDYFFLAYTVSTAFSPTDTILFSRLTRFFLMIQSLISLSILVLIVARAINIIA